MSNFGQAALTIGGAFVGSLFGMPQLGLLLGSYAGSFLFPTELPGAKGPRLKELSIQTSTVGVPIPIVYGTYALAGNVIWSGGLIEQVDTDEVGGKGGGPTQEVTTYTYFADFAVGICEGEIQGIRKIWADAVVIYDRSPQGDDESDDAYHERIATSEQTAALMTVYVGDETQVASPLIESYEGAGLVPAYRGLAYVEFERLPLEKYGNRIPNLRFEVYVGSESEADCTEYSAGHLEQWQYSLDSSVFDPRNPLNSHEYKYFEVGGTSWGTLSSALTDLAGNVDHDEPFLISEIPQVGDSAYVHGWSISSTPNDIRPCDAGQPLLDYIVVQMTLNVLPTAGDECFDASGSVCADWWSLIGVKHNPVYVSSGQFSGYYVIVDDGESPAEWFAGIPTSSSDVTLEASCVTPEASQVWALYSRELGVQRSLLPLDPCTGGVSIANAPGYCLVDGTITRSITWTYTAGTFKALQSYDDDGDFVLSYPVDPCLPSTHANYNSQAFWEAAYAADQASASPELAGGLTYGVDYPEVQAFAYVSSCNTPAIDAECVPISDIVDDICARAGLTSVDTSDLNACVEGYCITRVMSARDAIGPLRTYGLFDAVESGVALKFIERGHTSAATLTTDDLGAYEASQDRAPVTEIARIQEKELPRRLRLHYASPDRNYEPGEQAASRITTEAITEVDVELAIAMQDDNAAQLAEILLYDAWISRNSYRFSIDNSWLRLEPTDCVNIPIDGESQRVRITGVDYSIGGILRIDAVRDDEDAYASAATGHPPTGSVVTPPATLVCPSRALYLDLPRLRTADTDAGYYAAVYGLCSTWACAGIYRSSDGGVSYARVAQTQTQAVVGTIIDQDTAGTIYLTLDTIGATLSSITTDQRDAGQNVAAIGSDGAWEIIQFQTATLTSGGVWELSDIVRGLEQTTGYAPAAVGERFVLLSGPGILRIPENSLGIGVEKQLKVVSCGESLASVTAEDFTTQGLSYAAPLTGEGPIIVDPDDNTVTLNPASDLDNNARVGVRKNSAGSTFERRRINLIEGANVTLTVADDSANEEVDVTIAASGGSGTASSYNQNTASQGPGFASDTYITGSEIPVLLGELKVGTRYRLHVSASKTNAGIAAPIFSLRFGTNGTTADAAIVTHTLDAQTAASDSGTFNLDVVFRTVGAGTSAVVYSALGLTHNGTTAGFSNANASRVFQVLSSGFDSTTSPAYLGVSVNAGTSAAWTINQVMATLENPGP
jgi:hypothetical protein